MRINTYLACALFAGLSPLSVAQAAPAAGDNEFILQGVGTSDKDLDNNFFSASGSYGWFMSDQAVWGIRQSVAISETEEDNTRSSAATRLFYDWHFVTDRWAPYVGASVGYIYGDNTKETFSAGPEIGLKYYVMDKTFVNFSAEYQFLFEDSDEIDDTYDDGAIFYGLGVGFNF